jgi:hypothetical protein
MLKNGVKSTNCIWLQKNLDQYEFLTQEARELKSKLSRAKVENNEDIENLKQYYLKFYQMLSNNPLTSLNGISAVNLRQIITHHPEYFFVNNNYGIPVPIKFLKEQGLPIPSADHSQDKAEALKMIEDFRVIVEATAHGLEEKHGFLQKKKKKPNMVFAGILLVLITISLFFLNIGKEHIKRYYHIQQETTGTFVLLSMIFFFLLFFFIKAIREAYQAVKANKITRQYRQLIKAHDELMITKNDLEKQSQMLLHMQSVKEGNELQSNLKHRFYLITLAQYLIKDVNRQKKTRIKEQSIGKFSIFIMVLVTVFLIGLTSEKFRLKLNEFNTYDQKVLAKAGKLFGITPEKYLVVETLAVLRQEPAVNATMVDRLMNGTVVKAVGEEELLEGKVWRRFKTEDHQTGYLDVTALTYLDPAEVTITQGEATSQFDQKDGATHGANSLYDNNCKTYWQEGKSDDGIGEKITMIFEEATISRIRIINGNANSYESYNNYNRVKSVRLRLSNGFEEEITLEDVYAPTGIEITLSQPVQTNFLRLEILSIYRGSMYNDTTLSEIAIYE